MSSALMQALLGSGRGPVAFVRSSNSGFQSGSFTSDSFSFDATGCSFLIVFVNLGGDAVVPTSPAATYNGVPMTIVPGFPLSASGGISNHTLAFYLANPASGSNTLAVSWASNTATRLTSGAIGTSGGAGAVSGLQSSLTGGNLTVTSTVSSLVVANEVNSDGSAATISGATMDWAGVVGGGYGSSGGHLAGAASVAVNYSGTMRLTSAFSID